MKGTRGLANLALMSIDAVTGTFRSWNELETDRPRVPLSKHPVLPSIAHRKD